MAAAEIEGETEEAEVVDLEIGTNLMRFPSWRDHIGWVTPADFG